MACQDIAFIYLQLAPQASAWINAGTIALYLYIRFTCMNYVPFGWYTKAKFWLGTFPYQTRIKCCRKCICCAIRKHFLRVRTLPSGWELRVFVITKRNYSKIACEKENLFQFPSYLRASTQRPRWHVDQRMCGLCKDSRDVLVKMNECVLKAPCGFGTPNFTSRL